MKKHTVRTNNNLWQLQEAKSRFSQLIEDVTTKGFQTITKQGKPVAVIVSKKAFDKMTQSKTSFLSFFKASPCQDVELNIQRSIDLPREYDL